MDEIVALFAAFRSVIGMIAGFGADDSYSAASFTLLVAMAFFGTACISHLAERTNPLHLAFNFVAMFAGGVIGNALLRDLHLQLGNHLLVTAALTLAGMTAMSFALLFTYRRTDF